MKARLLLTLIAVIAACLAMPQSSRSVTYTMPVAGPMSMSTFVTTYLNPALANSIAVSVKRNYGGL